MDKANVFASQIAPNKEHVCIQIQSLPLKNIAHDLGALYATQVRIAYIKEVDFLSDVQPLEFVNNVQDISICRSFSTGILALEYISRGRSTDQNVLDIHCL